MRLSPVLPRRRRPNLKTVTWSDSQQRAVNELITEASALIDMFDQVSMLLGPDINLNDVKHINADDVIPPFKYDSILTESCNLLEQKLAKLRPVKFKEIEELSPELLKYA